MIKIVVTLNGKKSGAREVEVSPDDTVSSLKGKLSSLFNIPAEKQNLVIDGNQADNELKLSEYSIISAKIVNLVEAKEKMAEDELQLVAMIGNKKDSITVKKSDTIEQVKEKLKGIEMGGKFDLEFDGEMLLDLAKTVNDYAMKDKDSINILKLVPGGVFSTY